MVETLGCCGLVQVSCRRHDPQKYIIQGEFEIDPSPWLSLCASGLSVAVRLYSQENMDPSKYIYCINMMLYTIHTWL